MKKIVLLSVCLLLAGVAFATTVIPMSDTELYQRADVIVHGTVISSSVQADAEGRPETVSVIAPIEVLKGRLTGDLTLHQIGGQLPDGRFIQIFGRPEYSVGREVLVFAIARAEGGYQTEELMLGKFGIYRDETDRHFAVADLESGAYTGVVIYRGTADPSASGRRDLNDFLTFLRGGAKSVEATRVMPTGSLTPVDNGSVSHRIQPNWGNISNQLWRWNNGATAVWQRVGTANITGGGNAEAIGALATWTNEPNSTINYTDGSSSNTIELNAASSSGCGWNTCFGGSGVIGCGGPSGGGNNVFRGETYNTITGGFVQVRCLATFNGVSSTIFQSVVTHELGHTLGLGHSDQNASPHDVCIGDESLATMRSSVQNRTTLGTDDVDAVRWIYGDGLNSCTALPPPPTVASVNTTWGNPGGGNTITVNGTNFVSGSTAVTIGGVAVGSVGFISSTQLSVLTPALSPGTLNNVVVTTPGGSATLTNGFMANFLDVSGSHPFRSFVEKIFRAGITAGCGAGNYCPDSTVNRDQMAVFILRGEHGSAYNPPPATGTMFGDVPASAFAAAWIERLATEAITSGCGGGNYCPGSPVLRSQMSVFLLRGKWGSAFNPPPATGTMFTDVPASAFAAAWIEELANEGITGGCSPSLFCPNSSTTRGQMAVFLSVTFSLP